MTLNNSGHKGHARIASTMCTRAQNKQKRTITLQYHGYKNNVDTSKGA